MRRLWTTVHGHEPIGRRDSLPCIVDAATPAEVSPRPPSASREAAFHQHGISHAPACVGLTVRDIGHGMERDIREHIFECFFTTKPVGEGTGPGLAVVRGIVASLGGAITVTSVPLLGTTFDVYLPRFDGALVNALPPTVAIAGHERILFGDGEAAVARWGEQTLAYLGYQVVACTSGREGVVCYRTAPADLVITDILMPEQEGLATIKQLRAEFPAVKTIAISGGGVKGTFNFLKPASLLGAQRTLLKPFDLDELRQAIREMLR